MWYSYSGGEFVETQTDSHMLQGRVDAPTVKECDERWRKNNDVCQKDAINNENEKNALDSNKEKQYTEINSQ